MEQRELPVAALFRVLPDIPELTPLREALLSASTPDPAKAWASSSSYVTVDKRVLPADRLEAIARGAEDAVRRRVGRVYEALTGVLRSIATGDEAGAVDQLIVLGETAEADEQWRDARAYLESAAQLAAPISDRRPLSRALRRLARAEWNLGDVDAAYTSYRRSLAAARAAADQEATIVAFVGLGNMRSFQGRWSEAQAHYEAALALCSEEQRLLRGQLYTNLSMVAREQGLLTEAQLWLDQAEPIWRELDSKPELSVWYNNQGLLHLARERPEQAEAAFYRALEHAPAHFDRAMVLDNLAELAIRRGLLSEAESAARRAEEYALAAGSPRALAEVYTRLGKISRLRGDPNGVTFFEKAIELCRERHYPLLEGHTHFEYGRFRRALGDIDEARSYLERARDLFRELGATQDFDLAAHELERTVAAPDTVAAVTQRADA